MAFPHVVVSAQTYESKNHGYGVESFPDAECRTKDAVRYMVYAIDEGWVLKLGTNIQPNPIANAVHLVYEDATVRKTWSFTSHDGGMHELLSQALDDGDFDNETKARFMGMQSVDGPPANTGE